MAPQRYFRVGPSFWADHPNWTDDMRLAALYILTSPHRTTEGLFRLPLGYAADDMKWSRERFEEAFRQLIADRFIEYDETVSVCLIVNALRWQAPENPNQAKHAVRALKGLPDTPLLDRLVTLAATHSERFHEALCKAFDQRTPKSPSPSPSRISNSFSSGAKVQPVEELSLGPDVGTDVAGKRERQETDLAFSGDRE